MINNEEYKECIKFIDECPMFLEDTGVERAGKMFEALGNPQDKLNVIHVAGTNGKGSVCAFLDSIIRSNGYNCGLFTSPHLVEERERIRIGGELISKADFVRFFNEVKRKCAGIKLAYFDYFLGIAVLAFAEKNVDYCVMETGLGGKLDGTNAFSRKLISIITTISPEHTAILGENVEEIAEQKAGIIAKKTPVVYVSTDKRVAEVISKTARKCESMAVAVDKESFTVTKYDVNCIDFSVHNEYYKNDCFSVRMAALYQPFNCTVALTALAVLEQNGDIRLSLQKTKSGVSCTFWEGRMEQVRPDIYVDGAHNPEGIGALLETAGRIGKAGQLILLFSVVNDKDFEKMIRMICESRLFSGIVVTQIEGKRKLDENTIRRVFAEYTDCRLVGEDSIDSAFKRAVEMKNECGGTLFCTGSLYLVGELKALAGTEGKYACADVR